MNKNNILRFFGVLNAINWKKREIVMNELRTEFEERLTQQKQQHI